MAQITATRANHSQNRQSGHITELATEDLEVAGADISRPIIQIAAVAVSADLTELATFEAKLRFDRRRADPQSLTRKRYCAQTWAAEARSATTVAHQFADFLRRFAALKTEASSGRLFRVARLVAHNARFDGDFLQAWFERVGIYFPGDLRVLCTLQLAMWLFRQHPNLEPPRNFKLGTLCEYFGVPLPPGQAHTALADVRATVELYRRMTLLAAAESANRISRQTLARGRRVAGVAATGQQACRSRRRKGLKTCRLRRRPFLARQP